MSVGIIRASVEIRLECDVEDAEAQEYLEKLEEVFPSLNIINIESVTVEDKTFYDGVPVEALHDADANGQ